MTPAEVRSLSTPFLIHRITTAMGWKEQRRWWDRLLGLRKGLMHYRDKKGKLRVLLGCDSLNQAHLLVHLAARDNDLDTIAFAENLREVIEEREGICARGGYMHVTATARQVCEALLITLDERS
jgi:hypothetical protein